MELSAPFIFVAIVIGFLLMLFQAYAVAQMAGTRKIRFNQKIIIGLLQRIAKQGGTSEDEIREIYEQANQLHNSGKL